MMHRVACALITAAAVSAASTAPAAAIDLVRSTDWNGAYVGVQVGAKWVNSDWDTTCLGFAVGTTNPPCQLNGNPARPNIPTDASRSRPYDTLSARAGFYAGWNWQFAPRWVTGLEVDMAWADDKNVQAGLPGCALNCLGLPFAVQSSDAASIRTGWDAAMRARLGYLVTPDVLLYGAGGFAVQWIKAQAQCGSIAVARGYYCVAFDNSADKDILPGYTVGAGVEWRFRGNWILRGEYRYSQFADFHVMLFPQVPQDTMFAKVKVESHIATLGLSYLIGNNPP